MLALYRAFNSLRYGYEIKIGFFFLDLFHGDTSCVYLNVQVKGRVQLIVA